jgi:heptosyltransferase-3
VHSLEKIIVIATRQIGDVLITTPLIRRTRQIWPYATIDVLGYDNTMGMLEGNPDVRNVIESPEHPSWEEYKLLFDKIFRRYSLAIISQPSDRAYLYGFMASPRRIGIIPKKTTHNWWKRLICKHTVMIDYMSKHVVYEKFSLLDPYDPRANRFPLVIPPTYSNLPENLRAKLSQRYVVIHAAPMWQFKRWTVKGWVTLIRGLAAKNVQVILTGSKASQDKELNQTIIAAVLSDTETSAETIYDFSGHLSLAQVATLISCSLGYVGVDTSVTHLAAACGTKTVALFGATPPTNYGPWPIHLAQEQPWSKTGKGPADSTRTQTFGNVCLIQGPGECVPCRKSGCLNRFESHAHCMDSMDAKIVLQCTTNHFKI